MELETVNKLYLELSQFATAKTAKELAFENTLKTKTEEATNEANHMPDDLQYSRGYRDAHVDIARAYHALSNRRIVEEMMR